MNYPKSYVNAYSHGSHSLLSLRLALVLGDLNSFSVCKSRTLFYTGYQCLPKLPSQSLTLENPKREG